MVVANADATHPGVDVVPVPETGALLAAVRECLPGQEFEVIGKPKAALFRVALDRLGIGADEAVLVAVCVDICAFPWFGYAHRTAEHLEV